MSPFLREVLHDAVTDVTLPQEGPVYKPLHSQSAPPDLPYTSSEWNTGAVATGANNDSSQNSPGQQDLTGDHVESSSVWPNAEDYELVLDTGEPGMGPRLTYQCTDGSSVIAHVVTRDGLLRAARNSPDSIFISQIIDDSLKPLLRSHGLLPPGT
ncbi:hypothetical protein PG996_012272 [Apiospora saccharicola]|uniref:Uncharacterized protein n=1 Tax=Apiospora saccharicola TaxID=335842 RepID=A0ABR1U453_9PEZI